MATNVGTAGKLDFEFLLRMLNPALFVVLAGGLVMGFDLAALVIAGVVGYTIWGILNVILRRKKRNAMLAEIKNPEGIKVPFDFGLVASILNPVILFTLAAGIFQGWNVSMLVAGGVVGYGFWFLLNWWDRKLMGEFEEKVSKAKRSKKGKK